MPQRYAIPYTVLIAIADIHN